MQEEELDVEAMIDDLLEEMPGTISAGSLISIFIGIIYAYGMDGEKETFCHAFSYALMNSEKVAANVH